jgi:hypothetical protein
MIIQLFSALLSGSRQHMCRVHYQLHDASCDLHGFVLSSARRTIWGRSMIALGAE